MGTGSIGYSNREGVRSIDSALVARGLPIDYI